MVEELESVLVTDPKRKIGMLDNAYDLYIQNERVGFVWLEPHQYRMSLKAALDFSKLEEEVLRKLPLNILLDRNRTQEVDLGNIKEFTKACLFLNNDEDGTDVFEDSLSMNNPIQREIYEDMLCKRQISFARYDVDINKGWTRLKYTITASNPEVILEPLDMGCLNIQIPLAYGLGDNLARWLWERQKLGYEIGQEAFMSPIQNLVKSYILRRNDPYLIR